MNLVFHKVESDGFQSFGKMSFDIRNLGTAIVKGINKYEDKASSNGSGKSSIFEMIYFALFGKTTKGIADPTNRYLNRGYYVKLLFDVDGVSYEIIRANKHKEYKSALTLIKDGEDISCRNKSDTDKIIKNDILKVSSDVFLSTIYLAQGFDGRISSLTPSGRKERLEEITNTSSKIEEFKSKLTTAKAELSNTVNTLQNDCARNEGSIATLQNQLDGIKNTINGISVDYDASQIDELKGKANELCEILSGKEEENEKIKNKINDIKNKLNTAIYEADNCRKRLDTEKSNKKNILDGKPCPTCKRPMLDTIPQELIDEMDSKIIEIANEYCKVSNEKSDYENVLGNLEIEYKNNTKEYSDYYIQYDTVKRQLDSAMSNMQSVEKLEYLKNQVVSIEDEINKKSLSMEDIKKNLDVASAKYDIVSHCLLLVTKQYRNYLLAETIKYLNVKLEQYSSIIFSNGEKINLVADDTKLNIFLSEAQYESLSGGEKKKVDIALVLAQRDLALDVSDLTCNVLIFDEIFDGLDSKSLLCVLELLNQISDNYESLFIISHIIDLALPYDSIIIVEKDENRVSSIVSA